MQGADGFVSSQIRRSIVTVVKSDNGTSEAEETVKIAHCAGRSSDC